MKRALLLLSIAIAASAQSQTTTTLNPTVAPTTAMTAAQRLQLQQTINQQHQAAIQAFWAEVNATNYKANITRANEAIDRQAIQKTRVRGISYHLSTDPNTGGLVIGSPESSSMLPNTQTDTKSTTSQSLTTEVAAPVIGSIDSPNLTPNVGPPISGLSSMVTIAGQGFGTPAAPDFAPPGEVHFILPGGTNVKGTVAFWSATSIQAVVPVVSGIYPGNGSIYVVAGGRQSNATAFNFTPSMEERTIAPDPQHVTLDRQCFDDTYYTDAGKITFIHTTFPIGCKTDDQMFVQSPALANGWVVSQQIFTLGHDAVTGTSAGASITESHAGTNNLYTKVHSWANFPAQAVYDLSTVIRGPAGTNP
jgi:hypothetical protein